MLSPQTLDTRATDRFRIDNDGDARPNETSRFASGPAGLDGSQSISLCGLGDDLAEGQTLSKFAGGVGWFALQCSMVNISSPASRPSKP